MEKIYENEFDLITAACTEVRKTLGIGFSEKIYEEALAVELEFSGLKVESNKKIEIYYKKQLIGHFIADMLINDQIIIEIKREDEVKETHTEQLLNFLKATDMKLGVLINFPDGNREFQILRVLNITKY